MSGGALNALAAERGRAFSLFQRAGPLARQAAATRLRFPAAAAGGTGVTVIHEYQLVGKAQAHGRSSASP